MTNNITYISMCIELYPSQIIKFGHPCHRIWWWHHSNAKKMHMSQWRCIEFCRIVKHYRTIVGVVGGRESFFWLLNHSWALQNDKFFWEKLWSKVPGDDLCRMGVLCWMISVAVGGKEFDGICPICSFQYIYFLIRAHAWGHVTLTPPCLLKLFVYSKTHYKIVQIISDIVI